MEEHVNRTAAAANSQHHRAWTEFKDFIGVSKDVQQVRQRMAEFASDPLGENVLITGERGTGKELVASILHYQSVAVRNKSVYVYCNCGAIHSETLESHLFGHAHGSFTGSRYDRKGCFMEAHGGTLFLDEIGNLALNAQMKLLRAIEYKKITPLGTDREQEFNTRLVFATNKYLPRLCADNSFMPDLYDRLNIRHIHITALRRRTEDIPVLARHMAAKYAARLLMDCDIVIPQDVMELLYKHSFPGNVRELDNIINCAVTKLYHSKKKVMKPEHIKFKNTGTALPANDKNAIAEDFDESLKKIVKSELDKFRHLWNGRKSHDVPCLINKHELEEKIKKEVYEAVGRNKEVAARVLGLTAYHFRYF